MPGGELLIDKGCAWGLPIGEKLVVFFWGWGVLPGISSCFFQNRFIGIPKKPRNCDVILAV